MSTQNGPPHHRWGGPFCIATASVSSQRLGQLLGAGLFHLAETKLLRAQHRFFDHLFGHSLLVLDEHEGLAVHTIRVNADDTGELAQDVTRLDCRAASTKARDRALVDDRGLLDLDFLELLDLDALLVLLLEPDVEICDLRRALLALQLEVADTGGIENEVLDVLVLLEDRTDPLCR